MIPLSKRLTTKLKTKEKHASKVEEKRKEAMKEVTSNYIKSMKENHTIKLWCYLDTSSGKVEPFINVPCFPRVGILLERFFILMFPEVETLFSFFSLRKEA